MTIIHSPPFVVCEITNIVWCGQTFVALFGFDYEMMYLCKAKMCFSMNREEFEKVSAELKRVASDMPPEWGAVQNDELDDQVDVFAFSALADLDREMDGLCLCEKDRTYVRRRWYIYNRKNEKCNFEKRKVHFLVFSGHFGRVCLTAVQSSLKRCLIG